MPILLYIDGNFNYKSSVIVYTNKAIKPTKVLLYKLYEISSNG